MQFRASRQHQLRTRKQFQLFHFDIDEGTPVFGRRRDSQSVRTRLRNSNQLLGDHQGRHFDG